MRKYRELAKDISALLLGNFGNKIIGFFLIPLYTSVLSTEEYGVYDLIHATVSLCVPIFTLSIFDGTTRFLLDKNKNHNDVLKIAVKRSLISVAILIIMVAIGLILVNTLGNTTQGQSGDGAGFIYILKNYWYYFILYYIFDIIYEFGMSVARGMDKLSNVAIGGFINSALVLLTNLVFLLVFRWGLNGFFIAYLVSMIISSIYLFISSGIFKRRPTRKIDKNLEKEMLHYSKPLVFSTVGWWISNVSDRYIVTFFCGVAANGIYSVSYKIPSLLNMIHGIFNQAWVISAVKTFDKDDKDGFFKNIYSLYNIVMVMGCSFLILSTKLFAAILYKDDFYEAWQYVPFLLISSVFGGVSGVLGGVFTSTKNTKIMGWATIAGGITNIVLNFILIGGIEIGGTSIIPAVGVQGAAIATMISYVLIWILRMKEAKKTISLRINLVRDVISYIILLVQAIILLVVRDDNILLYSLQLIALLILMLMYARESMIAGKAMYKRVKKVVKSGMIRARKKTRNVQ